MCLKDHLNSNCHIELRVSDLNRWVQFFTADMGFKLVNMKKSVALLSNGYTLLELQGDNPKTKETLDMDPSAFLFIGT